MVVFSKTRIVYWENNINSLTTANIDNEVKLTYPDNSTLSTSVNPNYGLASLKGSTHNWHTIPDNRFGLYCTDAEIQSLAENFDEVYFKKASITVAHTIPTSRFPSGTGTNTQLSFNNTIYTLLHKLTGDQLDHTTLRYDFTSYDQFQIFRQSFDGATSNDNTRLILPLQDMVWKIPIMANGETSRYDQTKKIYLVDNSVNATGLPATVPTNEYYMTELEVAKAFLPELLQNNQETYSLYPGENQFTYEFNCESQYSYLDFNKVHMAEHMNDKSIHAWNLNSNFRPGIWIQMISSKRIHPQLRGPTVFENGGWFHFSDETARNNEVLASLQCGDTYSSKGFTQEKPLIFIKGCPILDSSSANVPHSFCGTVTWTLELEGKPRPMSIARPYIWQKVMPLRERYTTMNTATPPAPVNDFRQVLAFATPRFNLVDEALCTHVGKQRKRQFAMLDANDRGSRMRIGNLLSSDVIREFGDLLEDPAWSYTRSAQISQPTRTFNINGVVNKRVTRSQSKKAKEK